MKAAIVALLLLAAASRGSLQGRVTDAASGEPLAGVTVTVSGPAFQGEATEISDGSGLWVVTELPPGEYVVRFYFADLVVERPGVVVTADKTLQVNAAIETAEAKAQTYRIVERAPAVDVGSTQVQAQVTKELVERTPIRGRTYEGVVGLAPGAARDETGPTFGGATGPENAYLLDGMNTTSPAYGLLGTPLSLELIEETNVIVGGYNAEYGRATGGVVNVVTKSGTKDLHGGAWLNVTPFTLDAKQITRLGESIASYQRPGALAVDFGADLGGPLITDHLWFYAGLHPQLAFDRYTRVLRARTSPDGPFEDIPGTAKDFESTPKLINYILKLDLRVTDDHRATIEYLGAPSTFTGLFKNPNNPRSLGHDFNADPAIYGFDENLQVHDVILRWTSKLLDRRLQIDLTGGFHLESDEVTPHAKEGGQTTDTRERSLATFEDVPACKPTDIGGTTFDPCPVANYQYGGFGLYNTLVGRRFAFGAAITYLLELAGTHQVKLGGDFENVFYSDFRAYTGTGMGAALFTAFEDSVLRQALGEIDDAGNVVFLPGGFTGNSRTCNESVYLRDSWNVGFVPGLTINGGVRWELQQLKSVSDETVIDLSDNVAPRVGVVYDWSRSGRSKVYASFGRFYESIPLDINDRQFSGEGLIQQITPISRCTSDGVTGKLDASTCQFDPPDGLNGGAFARVAPGLGGQYSDEVVAGAEWDVGWDLVLGAAYIHRELGRVIEDVSPDGSRYIIANPGEPADPAIVEELRAQGDTETLELYQRASEFPKPKRSYDALVLTAHKRLSDNFILFATYTYSRTIGNYPGLYHRSIDQLDPNISTQYDLIELLDNRDGPLPGDRPHNFKVSAAWFVPMGSVEGDGLTLGLAFNALSGRPIEVLGAHPLYGALETFILPRGSGGRTPTVTSLDFHLGFSKDLGDGYRLEGTWDTFNVLNQQGVIDVDEEYTFDAVRPIVGGTLDDLPSLVTATGDAPHKNPNYGKPTAFQPPLSVRLGLRIRF